MAGVTQSVGLLLLVFLLLLVALFNAAEVAFLSSNRIRLQRLAQDGNKAAKVVLQLIENPSVYLSVLIFGITLGVSISSYLLGFLVEGWLEGLNLHSGVLRFISVAAVMLWTAVIMIFAEFIPKDLSVRQSEFFSLLLAYPTQFFVKLCRPVVQIMQSISDVLLRPITREKIRTQDVVTEEEIKMMVRAGERFGTIESDEKKMIDSIFEFSDTMVREVMTPRPDMICVPVTATLDEILDVILKSGHSRIPVNENSLDKISGMVYVKDLLFFLKNDAKQLNLREILRAVYHVPETKKVDDLLHEMQKNKMNMAIAVDEYGVTSGLVTIEDLLEEIVGEIQDEYDTGKEEAEIETLSEQSARVPGKTSLAKASAWLGMDLPDKDVTTVGGYVVKALGRMPREGEMLKINGVEFVVEKVEGQRVKRLKMTKTALTQEKKETSGT